MGHRDPSQNEEGPTRRVTAMGQFEETTLMNDQTDKKTEADAAKAPEPTAKHDPAVQEAEDKAQALAEEHPPGEVHVNASTTAEAIAQQHRDRDAAAEKLNEENAEGHEKNMAALAAQAEEANARTAHADDPRANFTPTGKEDNRNTPRVLPDGTKVWP